MRVFCFNLLDANNGNLLVCGTVHADTMEDAVISTAKRLQLVMEIQSHRIILWRKNNMVNLHVTVIPEYVLQGHIHSFETKPQPCEESEETIDIQ